MTINELKLSLQSTRRNPLRDKLRAMNNEQLLAEKAKATKAHKAKDTRANFDYMMFLDYLCEVRGITKPTPGIWV
jgi:adenine C2-methylase RlmN of 23S rRNA A2503 and tRNA A37